MHRHVNLLRIPIVSASESTAADHAERINMYRQNALEFPDATTVPTAWNRSEST